MQKTKDKIAPKSGRWNVQRVEEMVKEFSTFEKKDGLLNMGCGFIVAYAHMHGQDKSRNLEQIEIQDLVSAFNDCHPQKEVIKRHLLLQALFFTNTVTHLIIDGHYYVIHKSPPLTLSPNYDYVEKMKGINTVHIYGLFAGSHLGIPEITGKISTGLCKCCPGHEVDKIEERKIIDISAISRLNLEKDEGTIIDQRVLKFYYLEIIRH